LDEILVGPVPTGINKFILEADAPDYLKLPPDDVLGVTVVLVTCSYKEREFVRIGYYVNNEYNDGTTGSTITSSDNNIDENDSNEIPQPPPITPTSPNFKIEHVQRLVLADQPRVTRFPIPWTTSKDAMVDTPDIISNNDNENITFNEVDQLEVEQEILDKGYDVSEDLIDEDIVDDDDDDDEEEDDDENIDNTLEEDISDENDNPNATSNKIQKDVSASLAPVVLNDTELE
jgi:histone chaperone ASF1